MLKLGSFLDILKSSSSSSSFFFKQHSVAYWESPKYLEKLVIQNKNSQFDNI